MPVYTLTTWTVQPGREDEFVLAWSKMARKTRAYFPNASGTLLRDRERPEQFISFGPWDSDETVAAWRTSDTFTQGVATIRELLQDFEPRTMEHVRTVE